MAMCLLHSKKTRSITCMTELMHHFGFAVLGSARQAQTFESAQGIHNHDVGVDASQQKGSPEISHTDEQRGNVADLYSYERVLQECIYRKNLAQGKTVHAHMIKTAIESEVFLNTKLLLFYAKRGNVEYARQVFDKMPEPDLMSWNALLAEYSRRGYEEETLRLFAELGGMNLKADGFSFVSVLKACTGLRAIESGKQLHAHIVRSGLQSNYILMTALVDLYAKCRRLEDARQVFDETSLRDVVSWSAMIAGYVQKGNREEALALFRRMPRAGITPNNITFRSVFKACAGLETLEQGKQIHAMMFKHGFKLHLVLGNGLIDMYAKCGSLENALLVYEKMSERDVVSCNSMISGYTLQGQGEEALKLFCQMQQVGIGPDEFTFAAAVGTCASLASMQQGNQLHACIIKSGFQSDLVLECTLVDTYAKCGSIEEARRVFDLMPRRDVVLWTVIITAYAKHGLANEVVELFEEMKRLGMQPDHVTFLALLTACSYAGLLTQGWHYFYSMSTDHGIVPTACHYACMVDLLCRRGRLNEASDFIHDMPIKPTVTVWGALLRACEVHGNMELGRFAADRLFELDPQNSGCYVVLSNMYANVDKWGDILKVRKTMKDSGAKKEPGCSWIEVKNRVHVFPSGDTSHPQIEEIHSMLEKLYGRMREAGYLPEKNFKVSDAEQQEYQMQALGVL